MLQKIKQLLYGWQILKLYISSWIKKQKQNIVKTSTFIFDSVMHDDKH